MRCIDMTTNVRTRPASEPRLGLLILAALPLVVWVLHGSESMQVSALGVGVMLVLAVRLIARGQRIERAYRAARMAHAPKVPRKVLGALMIGAVTGTLAYTRFDAAAVAVLLFAAGALLALAAFGTDPVRDKTAEDGPGRRDSVLITLESALADAEARVVSLDDRLLLRETTAFGDHVAATLHRAAREDRSRLDRMLPLLDRIHDMLGAEVARLEEGDRGPFAVRRYCGKLALMREAVDSWAIAAAETDTDRALGGPQSRQPDGADLAA
jgi:hypothetical protein